MRRSTVPCAWLVIALCCAVGAPVARAQQPPAASAQQPAAGRMSADTPLATPGGATFTAPAGWSVVTRDASVVLETPEPDSHLAIVDVQAADADAAVAAAWTLY